MPLVSKLTLPQGSQFYIELYKNTSNDFLSWTDNGNLTKLDRNGPRVVLYHSCSKGSDLLHKRSHGKKWVFKMQFSKLFLSDTKRPIVSYLVYSIIYRSSTKVAQVMPLGSYLTPPQVSQFYIELCTTSSNYFLSWTTYGNLIKLNRNYPWSPTNFFEMVLIWLLERMFKLCPSINRGPAWGHIWFI